MAKKKKHEEHVNHERWLVSYADFVTLLFALFTALFAVSKADLEKLEKFQKSVNSAFSDTAPIVNPIVRPTVTTTGGANPDGSLTIKIMSTGASGSGMNSDDDGKGDGEEEDQGNKGNVKIKNPDTPHEEPDLIDEDALFNVENPALLDDEEGGGDGTKEVEPLDDIANQGTGVNDAVDKDPGAGNVKFDPLKHLINGMRPVITPNPETEITPEDPSEEENIEEGDGGIPGVLGTAEGGGSAELAAEIQEIMDTVGLGGKIEVREEKRGTVISLGEAAFFRPGSVQVMPSSSYQLDKVVNALRGREFQIRIEGHTDNTPIRSGRYSSNYELSSLRAAHVVEFMIEKYGFTPDMLSCAGYGPTKPLATNDTLEGRQKNRRVDIVILNEASAALEP